MNSRACPTAGRLCLLILVLSPQVFAEREVSFASDANPIIITARALKGLDFDGWDSEMRARDRQAGIGIGTFEERLAVRFHHVPGYSRQWKVDHSLQFHFDRPFSASSGLVVGLTQKEYRDQAARRYQTGRKVNSPVTPYQSPLAGVEYQSFNSVVNRSSITNFAVGGRLVTENGIRLEGLLGPVFDHRGGVSQEGVKYDFRFDFQTDSIAWNGSGWLSHFGSGDDHNLKLAAGGKYGLSEAADDRFEARYVTGTRREFSPVGSGIGRRDDRRIELTNDLTVTISQAMNFAWSSNLTNRMAESKSQFPGRRDREFNWQNDLKGAWSETGKFVEFIGGIDIQQQEYAGGLTQGRNSRLQLTAGYESYPIDSTVFEAAAARYRFDTPDIFDFNDRDELRWQFALRSGIHLTSSLLLRGGIEANLNHLVYIHRSRSGENRWTRQFTLYSEVPWRDHPIENNARFAVSAHYTDFDFSPYDLTDSRLFRAFSAVDTFRLVVAGGWGGEISAAGQLNDHGELDWSEWIENVSERGYSYTVTMLPFRKIKHSEIALGWLTHRRFSKMVNDGGNRSSGEDVRSRGPVARIFLNSEIGVRLEFLATFLTIRQTGKSDEALPDVNFTVTWLL